MLRPQRQAAIFAVLQPAPLLPSGFQRVRGDKGLVQIPSTMQLPVEKAARPFSTQVSDPVSPYGAALVTWDSNTTTLSPPELVRWRWLCSSQSRNSQRKPTIPLLLQLQWYRPNRSGAGEGTKGLVTMLAPSSTLHTIRRGIQTLFPVSPGLPLFMRQGLWLRTTDQPPHHSRAHPLVLALRFPGEGSQRQSTAPLVIATAVVLLLLPLV